MYTEIEEGLVEMLRAAEGLAGVVKTFETSIRDCLFSADKQTKGFRAGELPAIGVSAQLKPAKSRPFTAGEKEYEIPVTVALVTRAQQPKAALSGIYDLLAPMEQVFDAARRSGNPLGPNVLVIGDLASDAAVVADAPFFFGVATVEATVLKVVEL